MSSHTEYYEMLGVSVDATDDEIKRAYKRRAMSTHPDKNPSPSAHSEFQELQSAYAVLSDPQRRAAYDRYGPDSGPGSASGGGGGMSQEDLFSQMFGGFGFDMSGAGEGFGFAPSAGRGDEEIDYDVSLEDVYCGKEVTMTVERTRSCAHCKGTGGKSGAAPKACGKCEGRGKRTVLRQVGPMMARTVVECEECHGLGQKFREKDRCKRCHGKRVTKEKKRLVAHVERGARDGQRIILHGEGDQAPGQQPGDVILRLHLRPHTSFEQHGLHLLTTVHITLSEALLGFERVALTHLDGRGIRLASPPGKAIASQSVFRVPGEGMPAYRRPETRGDLFVLFEIEMPSEEFLRSVDRKALERLLPPRKKELQPESGVVDDVGMEESGMEEFVEEEGEWEDEEEEEEFAQGGRPECTHQ
ncbi:DnaJ-domain-containing protein [Calocera viscosa TUFC12733]|uniref:DnaJ-domain-containing protein n=1 Tax=Calocera viscosa (strain TUFC12733) TaxID=1330018 RepID=A0A167MDV1_CALVF|nr:DnaJ-domain-containing protein [Calocera viscosa TUFC12733]